MITKISRKRLMWRFAPWVFLFIHNFSYRQLKKSNSGNNETKKKILLLLQMRLMKKIFTRAAAKLFNQIFNQFKFFAGSWCLKNYSNNTFLCWKRKSPIFYCSKRNKYQLVGINLLVENCLNSEFYWPNDSLYWFKT